MMAPAVKYDESEKAEQLLVLSYEGLLKTIWVPKKFIKKEKRTIEGHKGEVYTLPHRFAKGHNIPDEVFVTDLNNFIEITEEMLGEISPNLDEVTVTFSQTTRVPDRFMKLVEKGYVPLKKAATTYFVPADQIISFDPRARAWKILANTDFIKPDAELQREYKSFVFIVNGEVWQWKDGTIIPPLDDENFITPPTEDETVVQ